MLTLLVILLLSPIFRLLLSSSRVSPPSRNEKKRRVAVIGGGVAGCACAWALEKSGKFEVELFEAQDSLGGNAKTFDGWKIGDEKKKVRTGLSVLAWPHNFHHLRKFMSLFKIKTEEVDLGFIITDNQGNVIFDHHDPSQRSASLKQDLSNWLSAIRVIRGFNTFFSPQIEKGLPTSLYFVSMFNPMNYIPLRFIVRLFGVSQWFWDHLLVPMQASSFLTFHLNAVPAVIAPFLEDVISFCSLPRLETWTQNSSPVYATMCANVKVHTSCPVVSVTLPDITRGQREVEIVTKRDVGTIRKFDQVVFACDAYTANQIVTNPSRLAKTLLSSVVYCDEFEPRYTTGQIHQNASVMPPKLKSRMLARNCNWIKVIPPTSPQETIEYENMFILSSWLPAARPYKDDHPMLVSYGVKEQIKGTLDVVRNVKNHPYYCASNQVIVMLMNLIQGANGAHYVGSYITPANAHDTSLLCGLVIANAMGAGYQFKDDPVCKQDFNAMAWLLSMPRV